MAGGYSRQHIELLGHGWILELLLRDGKSLAGFEQRCDTPSLKFGVKQSLWLLCGKHMVADKSRNKGTRRRSLQQFKPKRIVVGMWVVAVCWLEVVKF